jgi:hypothetical protein
MIMKEQEAAGVCYLCVEHGHISVGCPILESGGPQNKVEGVGQRFQSNVNAQNLPKLYKIRKEPIHDPGATMHQQAGTGIWCRDMPKKSQKQHHKKVAGKQHNRNWQGSRRYDVEAVNQVFGVNEVEIKLKSLEVLRLLRQADQA